jgi:hypothetical protein
MRRIQPLLIWTFGLGLSVAFAATPPSLVSLSPAVSNGGSQILAVSFSAPGGYQTLDVLNILINTYLDGRQACYLAYSRSANALYIVADNGDASQITGKVMDGTGAVANSQCTVTLANSFASGSGATFTLVLNLSFSASFGGNKVVYAAARDLSQNNSGWQTMGAHWVSGAAATYPNPESMSPSTGSTLTQTLTFTFQDQSSANNLQTVWALINSAIDGRAACYLAYYRPGNQLYLYPDNGDGSKAANMPLTGPGTLSNSQCSVTAQGASIQTNGNTLAVTLPVTFTPAFAGFKGVWLAAQTMNGAQTSAWQALGAWSVPVQAQQGTPSLSTTTLVTGITGATAFIAFPILNSGAADAANVQISSITLGGGALLSPTLPVSLGTIAANKPGIVNLVFNASALNTTVSYPLTVSGTYTLAGSSNSFSLNASVNFSTANPYQPSAPWTVTPVLGAGAVQSVISAQTGGTLTTTGADGTVFTLTLPANALLSDELITMTPVKSLGNMPSGTNFVAGVELQPDGLLLLQPGTLTIQSPTAPAGPPVGFEYSNGGQSFNFDPLPLINTPVFTLSIDHFSGHGELDGVFNDQFFSGATDARFVDSIARILQQYQSCSILCDLRYGSKVFQELEAYYNWVLKPGLDTAGSDDSKIPEIVGETLLWLDNVKLISASFFLQAQVLSVFLQMGGALQVYFDHALEECVSGNSQAQNVDLTKMGSVIALLLGMSIGSHRDLLTLFLPNWQQQIAACQVGPLSLDVDSTVFRSDDPNNPPASTVQSHVTAQAISLKFDPVELQYAGSGPLNYNSFSFTTYWGNGIGDCSTGVGHSGSVSVTGKIDVNLKTPDFGALVNPDTVKVHLVLNPDVTETISVGGVIDKCIATPPATVPPPGEYGGTLTLVHWVFSNDSSAPSPYLPMVNSPFPFVFSKGGGGYVSENTTLLLKQQQ